ncbi:MAG TPA: hypothetical protein H9824_05695 [Candidatus Bacteroides pullicola]|uniref:Uncharacterized protein n=1 Tax=Candidatus Bacteroides pullicola TaxID=2838475 RepID=A0A9D2CL85_9BACE|nr:hypothetical protein [Candidatus Bacteroides pullicola]
MNKETIEKAAREYAKDKYGGENAKQYAIAQIHAGRDGFIDGAQWRINSVWHDGTVSCQSRRKALVLFKNGNAAVYNDLRDLTYERLWGEVDKFAYLDDLLPDGKEADQ